MKVLVVLCAVVASCLASPYIGYGYSAISPLTGYSSIAAPYAYAYNAPILGGAYPYVAPVPSPVAPVGVKTQHHSQDELGNAAYGHSEPLQSHEAVQDAHGNKVGTFSYVDPHGAVHQRNYVADGLGFRVSANDLPVAPAGPGPVVPAETPEVVAAKINHFAAHGAALHLRKRRSPYYGSYYGPQALPVVTPSGHLADTPEVAAAKAAHFAEHAKQSGHVVPYAGPFAHGFYSGAYATPVVTPSGHLADTPEVAAAKAAHFAEHAKASGHAVAYAAPYSHGYYSSHYSTPVVTPSGYLADTPEVAAAKAAHFAEHAARSKRSVFYQTPASTSPLAPAVAPVVPVPYAAVPAHPAPLAYHAPAFGVPAIKTEIVHNPFHAVSYRIDPHY